ncbi:MAG: hypothetical protein RLP12_16575, partial [Ekhidna sp.]
MATNNQSQSSVSSLVDVFSDNLLNGGLEHTMVDITATTFSWETFLKSSANSSLITEQMSQVIKQAVQQFTTDSEFESKMALAFGEDNDYSSLKTAWQSGEFNAFPSIEIRTGAELNNANAAYAGATNTIYFSEEFLHQYAHDSQAITSVLLEEFGHYVDFQVNDTDSPGDEGRLFAATVLGQNLDSSTLDALKQEDDSTVLNLDNSNIIVEQSIGTTNYVESLDFGEFSLNATTAEYLKHFFGVDVSNSWEYNSGDQLKRVFDYEEKTESFGINGSVDLGSVDLDLMNVNTGVTLESGSIGVGLEAKAGYNLGELNLNLPLSPSLDAGVIDSQLTFNFNPDFDGEFEYIEPFAYASLAAIIEYDFGGLNAFFNVGALGQNHENKYTILPANQGSFSPEIINLDTRQDTSEDGQNQSVVISGDFLSIEFHLPDFDPELIKNAPNKNDNDLSNDDEYSLEMKDEVKLLSSVFSVDSLFSTLIPQLAWISGEEEKEFKVFGKKFEAEIEWSVLPIEISADLDFGYGFKTGIRDLVPDIVGGEFSEFSNSFTIIDELLDKDIDNDSKIDLTLEFNPEVFFNANAYLKPSVTLNVDLGEIHYEFETPIGEIEDDFILVENLFNQELFSSELSIFQGDVGIRFNDLYQLITGSDPTFNKIDIEIPFHSIFPNVGTAGDDVLSLPESAGVEN